MTEPTGLTNNDLILLAILLAGGAEDFADIEDVGIWANKLSPQRFGWRTKDFPSDKKVSQAITDLERERDNLTRRGAGDVATRRLTPEGLAHAMRVGAQLSGKDFETLDALLANFADQTPQESVPATASGRRPGQNELRALHHHPAFAQWVSSGNLDGIEPWELSDSINCLPDAPHQVVKAAIESLQTWAARWQDKEIAGYLEAIADVFKAGVKPSRGTA
jgi:hypothetical protein